MFGVQFSDTMEAFYGTIFSFPTIIFSIVLLLATLYWCVAALGLIDIDIFDVDADVDVEMNAEVGSVAGLLLRFGLNGVPITIIVTLIALCGWTISALTTYYLLPLIPTTLLKILVAVVILFAALYTATLLTAFFIRPLRPFFLAANQQQNIQLIGKIGIVRTGTVSSDFGEADLADGGAGLIVKIRSFGENEFKKGDRVVLIEHNTNENSYKVISESEYNN